MPWDGEDLSCLLLSWAEGNKEWKGRRKAGEKEKKGEKK